MKIYLASSWRNDHYPTVLAALRSAGHEVHDFLDPRGYFSWQQIDDGWKTWTGEQYRAALQHQAAQVGLQRDFGGMQWCDALVLLMPAGRSASLELGWAIGAGKRSVVLWDQKLEPELMMGLADEIVLSLEELLYVLVEVSAEERLRLAMVDAERERRMLHRAAARVARQASRRAALGRDFGLEERREASEQASKVEGSLCQFCGQPPPPVPILGGPEVVRRSELVPDRRTHVLQACAIVRGNEDDRWWRVCPRRPTEVHTIIPPEGLSEAEVGCVYVERTAP
jgi:hypothetical protein